MQNQAPGRIRGHPLVRIRYIMLTLVHSRLKAGPDWFLSELFASRDISITRCRMLLLRILLYRHSQTQTTFLLQRPSLNFLFFGKSAIAARLYPPMLQRLPESLSGSLWSSRSSAFHYRQKVLQHRQCKPPVAPWWARLQMSMTGANDDWRQNRRYFQWKHLLQQQVFRSRNFDHKGGNRHQSHSSKHRAPNGCIPGSQREVHPQR